MAEGMNEPSASAARLEHVEKVLAWGAHMMDDHPLLVWLGVSYLICSLLAIAALASAVANG